MELNRGEEKRAEREEGECWRESGGFPDMVNALWSPLTEQSGKHGSALQREYAWCGVHGSGNNKVVKSLSPQAPCMAYLDPVAGVLSLLLYLQCFLTQPRTPPSFSSPQQSITLLLLFVTFSIHFSSALYIFLTFCPPLSFSLSQGFYFLSILQLPVLFLYRFLDFY